jgi:hypothetical protein
VANSGLTPAQRLPGLVEDEQEVAGGHTQVHHPVELGFAADAFKQLIDGAGRTQFCAEAKACPPSFSMS